ncbi:MAG: hypothetical protein QOI66_5103 [Myxococcales bacterium]|nr:hypothetical protein [Myxococcales bacterium]
MRSFTMMARLLVIAAVTLGVVGVMGGCGVCPPVNQEVFFALDAPELASVVADCQNRVPPRGETRCAANAPAPAAIDCPCLPLCERVYAVVVPDARRPPLEQCSFGTATGGRGRVDIQYRTLCE